MNVVYVVGDHTDELRYSLRSLRNVEHDGVWVVAEKKPSWYRGGFIHTKDRYSKKGHNINHALLAAAESPDVSDPFIYFNDDFFAVKPSVVPTVHRGPCVVSDPIRHRVMSWHESIGATAWVLKQWGYETLNYELHIPIVFRKQPLADVIRRGLKTQIHGLQSRTLYGNVAGIGGEKARDVKVRGEDAPIPDGAWVSTSNQSFSKGLVGRQIRDLFPDPSPYEEA